MRTLKLTIAAAAVLSAASFTARADYYTPPHDYAYLRGFDGPGSQHTQVPYGFDKSRDQDKVTVVQPGPFGTVFISETDKKNIKGFMERSYRSTCPRGSVQIGRECKTDENKNQYVIGQPLAATVIVQPAPVELVETLQPVPTGYRYVEVGTDVLLVDDQGMVLDAVTLY